MEIIEITIFGNCATVVFIFLPNIRYQPENERESQSWKRERGANERERER